MTTRAYVDRLSSDYRKTFGTASGKHVLMDLYKNLHGMDSTFPVSGNATELALNEGKRWALLYLTSHLKEHDQDLRQLWEQHIAERTREEQQ